MDHLGTILTVSRNTAHHRSLWSALANTSWLIVIFGAHQGMAQLIATSVLISPWIHKDFPVSPPLLARGNCASVNLNHHK